MTFHIDNTLFAFCSEAIETRHALHGIRWPTSNPKCLNVDFGTESLMEKAVASTADEVKPVLSRDERIVSSNDLHEPGREKVIFVYFDVDINTCARLFWNDVSQTHSNRIYLEIQMNFVTS